MPKSKTTSKQNSTFVSPPPPSPPLASKPIIIPCPPQLRPEDLVSEQRRRKDPSKPCNAFIIFRREFVKHLHENGTYPRMVKVSQLAGDAWRAQPLSVKKEYKKIAEKTAALVMEVRRQTACLCDKNWRPYNNKKSNKKENNNVTNKTTNDEQHENKSKSKPAIYAKNVAYDTEVCLKDIPRSRPLPTSAFPSSMSPHFQSRPLIVLHENPQEEYKPSNNQISNWNSSPLTPSPTVTTSPVNPPISVFTPPSSSTSSFLPHTFPPNFLTFPLEQYNSIAPFVPTQSANSFPNVNDTDYLGDIGMTFSENRYMETSNMPAQEFLWIMSLNREFGYDQIEDNGCGNAFGVGLEFDEGIIET
ncbi:4292_t:CDS:1 [Paraglomus brasilianum]|uniref:4292_t:CDS:1 n=1 Tax=Paraglomus brasilianum TaxID=144538 RepID=A0A9N9C280_9GLOM|nr:4292_t:CDS:1 [Paraglomus brasilianum]